MSGENGGRARRMQLMAVLMLLVVFVAGGLVGAAVERGRDHGRRDQQTGCQHSRHSRALEHHAGDSRPDAAGLASFELAAA